MRGRDRPQEERPAAKCVRPAFRPHFMLKDELLTNLVPTDTVYQCFRVFKQQRPDLNFKYVCLPSGSVVWHVSTRMMKLPDFGRFGTPASGKGIRVGSDSREQGSAIGNSGQWRRQKNRGCAFESLVVYCGS